MLRRTAIDRDLKPNAREGSAGPAVPESSTTRESPVPSFPDGTGAPAEAAAPDRLWTREFIQVCLSGFLSYAFFSPAYAHGRGMDSLSGIIHPEAGSSLYRFRNLAWDLSGAADFIAMEVRATLSGPDGHPQQLTLRRTGP